MEGFLNGYTKLFGSIVASTIWGEDDKTRLVWVTMLALADQHGEVHASIPGLAQFSRVSVVDTEGAIIKLLAPDHYSRTKDYDGRRIETIDGGWVLLNHAKYRAKMSQDDQREKTRLRVEKFRERGNSVTGSVTPGNACNADVTKSNACNDKQKQIQKQIQKQTHKQVESNISLEIYDAYPLKVGKPAALRAIEKAMAKIDPEKLLELTKAYAVVRGRNAPFTPNPSTWFNQERFNDPPETWADRGKQQLTADHEGGF